jgi:hypothetical protein
METSSICIVYQAPANAMETYDGINKAHGIEKTFPKDIGIPYHWKQYR